MARAKKPRTPNKAQVKDGGAEAAQETDAEAEVTDPAPDESSEPTETIEENVTKEVHDDDASPPMATQEEQVWLSEPDRETGNAGSVDASYGSDTPADSEMSGEAGPTVPAADSATGDGTQDATGDGADDRMDERADDPSTEANGERDGTPQHAAGDASEHAATQAAPPAVVPSPEPRRGGFLPTVLGGVVAAGIGAGAVLYLLPEGWRDDGVELNRTVATQAEELQALRSDVEAIREATGGIDGTATDLAALAERVGAVEATAGDAAGGTAETLSRLEALNRILTDYDARLTAVEKQPADGGAASASALEAFEREMADMRAQIAASVDDAEARVQAAADEASQLKGEAAEAARKARASAALGVIRASLETGAPMGNAPADLAEAGIEVPPELADGAAIPTLATLRAEFPAVARRALGASLQEEAAQGETGGDQGNRLAAFLRSQTNARSLTPQEGDDPDAVLSRAESALADADLETALAEIAKLPEAGQAEFADWRARAETRVAVLSAVDALAAEVN